MKTGKIALIFVAVVLSALTGCSNAEYQKDTSYETDIVGEYEQTGYTEGEVCLYYYYKFNTDNTFEYRREDIDRKNQFSGTYEFETITDHLTKVTLNITSEDRDSIKIYKYKNMIGYIMVGTDEFPASKTFDYIIPSASGGGFVFTEDGYYHACSNTNGCQDVNAKDIKYIRKGNIIYFKFETVKFWQIDFYIEGNGLFTPEVYKIKPTD